MSNISYCENGYPSSHPYLCDLCHAATRKNFCLNDSAYLCTFCDESIHSANSIASQHERVWICDVCKNAPAALACEADATLLCKDCDVEIHSANPLARRHIPVPINPIANLMFESSSSYLDDMPRPVEDLSHATSDSKTDEIEADSWLLLNSEINDNIGNNGFLHIEDTDQHNSFTDCNQGNWPQPCNSHQLSYGTDSFAPVQSTRLKESQDIHLQRESPDVFLAWEHKLSYFDSNDISSTSQTVQHSLIDIDVFSKVAMTKTPNSSNTPLKATANICLNRPIPIPLQYTMPNREEKVLKYREKRMTRKFGKKVRYATRKAHAEARPRVKGRFAKRTELDLDMEQMISLGYYDDDAVPSF